MTILQKKLGNEIQTIRIYFITNVYGETGEYGECIITYKVNLN